MENPLRCADVKDVRKAKLSSFSNRFSLTLTFFSVVFDTISRILAKMSTDYKFEGWLGKNKDSAGRSRTKCSAAKADPGQ